MKTEKEILDKIASLNKEMAGLEKLTNEQGEEGRGSIEAKAILRELTTMSVFKNALEWVLDK